ncbi:uncharacterized protein LOC103212607 [Orycteropus afer afer]|uniref:Uncharacterized protein LOC103212607 n=1 Tax=Orycteropus afer afer TaxID=1230840 RepID=A0A8B7BD49_ORYAF|nr:uncharacterized protein LOC103212607 [Orycteropus afer afer]
MQFRSPPAARSSQAPQAASPSETAAPAPGQPGPSCPTPGASRGGRPRTPPAGRVEEEEEEEEEEDVNWDPYSTQDFWLHCCQFSLKGGEKSLESMGGCEVREFLLQFGFFLPLLTAWSGECSHVSNNQGKGWGGETEGGLSETGAQVASYRELNLEVCFFGHTSRRERGCPLTTSCPHLLGPGTPGAEVPSSSKCFQTAA